MCLTPERSEKLFNKVLLKKLNKWDFTGNVKINNICNKMRQIKMFRQTVTLGLYLIAITVSARKSDRVNAGSLPTGTTVLVAKQEAADASVLVESGQEAKQPVGSFVLK